MPRIPSGRKALSCGVFDGYGRAVLSLLWAVLRAARSLFRTQRGLALENLALRQQVSVLLRTSRGRRLRLGALDRAFWVVLSERWAGWRDVLAIVAPATVAPLRSTSAQRPWMRTQDR